MLEQNLYKENSSFGKIMVSKTIGKGFKSLFSCLSYFTVADYTLIIDYFIIKALKN